MKNRTLTPGLIGLILAIHSSLAFSEDYADCPEDSLENNEGKCLKATQRDSFKNEGAEIVKKSLISDIEGFESLKQVKVDTASQFLNLVQNNSFSGVLFSDFKKLLTLNLEINESLSPMCGLQLYYDSQFTIWCDFDSEESGGVDIDFKDIASFALKLGITNKERIEEIEKNKEYKSSILLYKRFTNHSVKIDTYGLSGDEAIVRVNIDIEP